MAYAIKLGVLALALAALYALAKRMNAMRFFGGSRRRCITVVETTMLAPHLAVHLLRVGRRHLLVAAGTNGAAMLLLDVEVAELRDLVAGRLEQVDLAVES